MSADPHSTIEALRAELEAVRRREAQYRADMVAEFLDRGERNTYLHTLREEKAALVRREQEASADIEFLVRKLEAEADRRHELERRLESIWRSAAWRLCGPLRALERRFSGRQAPGHLSRVVDRAPVEGGIFTYYLHTSPFRVYRGEDFVLRGWAWPQDGRAVTAVRINLDGRLFMGRHGLEEPEVIARYGEQPANPRPGFEVRFETPPGRHQLSLEAEIERTDWRWIVRTSIWCEPQRP